MADSFYSEWKRAKDREKFFSSNYSSTLLEAMERIQLRQQFLVKSIGYDDFPIIVADKQNMPSPCDEKRIFEFLTAFFPPNLPVATVQKVEKIRAPHHNPRKSRGARPDENSTPYDGLVSCHHGWALGAADYRGQPVLRMVYIMRWEDEEKRHVYRNQAVWKKWTVNGRVLDLAMDSFLDDLQELGMLGFESQTCQLQQLGR